MTQHGVKDATDNERQIKSWWADWPDANVGVATGRVSGIAVLDVDPRNNGDETLSRLKEKLGGLPKTVRGKTGGRGHHIIFRYPTGRRLKKDSAGKTFGAGIDILSDGAIMIAPPSNHISGSAYRWAEGRSPVEAQVRSLPQSWLDQASHGNLVNIDVVGAGCIREGGRNNALTVLAGTLRAAGVSPPAMLAAVRTENTQRCSPPLDDVEVQKIVDSVSKYTLGSSKSDPAEQVMARVLDQYFAGGEHLLYGADSSFWRYTGTHWEPVADAWIQGRILATIESLPSKLAHSTASVMSQVRTLLQAKLSSERDFLAFRDAPHCVINCANGELWLGRNGRLTLKPHDPKSFLRHVLDVEFQPEAECPLYNKALRDIFAEAEKPKAMRRHWHELCGYIIQPNRDKPIILALLGVGDNGKTKLVQTLTRLLGKGQVYAERVGELDKNRFSTGALLGKRLFLDDDVQAGTRLPDGTLKKISEAKEVTAEQKHRPHFNFVVRTVPMLLCNNVPSLGDLSWGMRRRLMVIPFDRTFRGSDKDDTLFDRIWAKEMSGILNEVVNGYVRLTRRGHFKVPGDVRCASEKWLEQANPLPAFLKEHCTQGDNGKILISHLFEKYQKWANRSGYTKFLTLQSFGASLEALGYEKTHGNQGNVVRGLKLKPPN